MYSRKPYAPEDCALPVPPPGCTATKRSVPARRADARPILGLLVRGPFATLAFGMKTLLLGLGIAASCLLSVPASAAGELHVRWRSGPPPPLHPTLVYADYKGQSLPVVSVSGETPQVEVDGKYKGIAGRKARFTPLRGSTFAPGMIEMKAMQAGSRRTDLVLMFSDGSNVSGGTINARSDFSATVVPSQDYKDCYVAIVFYDQAFVEERTDTHNAFVQFEKIKDLVGGKENTITLNFGYLEPRQDLQLGYFPLFFTNGVEIRSNQCELTAQFFRRIELIRHEAILKAYCEKNTATASAKLEPYLRVPVLFPNKEVLVSAPATTRVSFMVDADGKVESLQFEEALPAAVSSVLTRTLNGWLFLPRIKAGRPERTLVKVPVVLRTDTPAD